MRVAEDVSNTINAYIAFRSVVLLAKKLDLSIAIPLFCTGYFRDFVSKISSPIRAML